MIVPNADISPPQGFLAAEAPQRKLITLLVVQFASDTSGDGGLFQKGADVVLAAVLSNGGVIERAETGRADTGVIVALFGVPLATEFDAETAVRTAFDIHRELSTLPNLPVPTAQIGVHLGQSVLERRIDGLYRTSGETLDEALFVARSAPAGKTLITRNVSRSLKSSFPVSELELVRPDGRLIKAHLLMEPTASAVSTVSGKAKTKMIGRERELQQLIAHYNRFLNYNLTVSVGIIGTAGIGKARLIQEFRKKLGSIPKKRFVLATRLKPSNETTPFSTIRNLLLSGFELADADNRVLAVSFGQSLCKKVFFTEREIAYISRLLGLDFQKHDIALQTAQDQRTFYETARALLRRFLEETSRTEEVILSVEDAQWADSESIKLIDELSRNQKIKLFILFGSRPSPDRTLDGYLVKYPELIELKPLSPEMTEKFVAELLAGKDIGADDRTLLIERSEGIPLYAEELVKVIQSGHQLELGASAPERTERRMVIPDTVQGILQARFDSLSKLEQDILRSASVLGRVFWKSSVEHISGSGMTDSALQKLTAKEFIFSNVPSQVEGDSEYSFKHQLMRDAIYDMLLPSQEKLYHRRAAEWMQTKHFPERLDGLAAIAQHYEQAGDAPDALRYYDYALSESCKRFYAEGVTTYERKALEMIERTDLSESERHARAFVVMLQAMELLLAKSLISDYKRHADELVRLAELLGDTQMLISAYYHSGVAQRELGDLEAATDNYEHAERLAVKADDAAWQAQLSMQRAILAARKPNYDEALRLFNHALEIATLEFQYKLYHDIRLQLGIAQLNLSRYSEASENLQAALEYYTEQKLDYEMTGCLGNLGVVCSFSGDYERAAEYYRRAIDAAKAIGNRKLESHWTGCLGSAELEAFNYEQALSLFAHAADAASELQDAAAHALWMGNIGYTCYLLGCDSDAASHFSTARDEAQEAGATLLSALDLCNEGLLKLREDKPHDAIKLLESGLQVFMDAGAEFYRLNHSANLARALARAGKHKAAKDLLVWMKMRLEENPVPSLALRHLLVATECAFLAGRYGEALELSNQNLVQLQLAASAEPVLLYWLRVQLFSELLKHPEAASFHAPDASRAELTAALKAGQALLVSVAERIQDQDLRRAYLENVPEHRQLLAAVQAQR